MLTKVEQINNKGLIVKDYDNKISLNEIKNILNNHLEVLNNKNPFHCRFNDKEITILIKQITYLGHPHKIFKKRIQIPKKWKIELKKENTFLVGLYRYYDNNIFVFFDTEKYKNNRLNNSSAHIHTIDLQKGIEYGIFEKIDSRKNKINIIKEDKLENYIDNLLNNKENSLPKEIKLFNDFSISLEKRWEGKKCYKEMFDVNYRNKAQSEWPGFYLEFRFEDFLNKNPEYKSVCLFVHNKKRDELDFDLNFMDKYLGDLKAHSKNSSSIPGNDKESFLKALEKYKKFWYVVFYHESFKDKDFNNEVTLFWNKLLNKVDTLSYSKKMKNSIVLENVKILEINNNNYMYISDMKQGDNSDGSKREMKIQIKSNVIDNFLIYNKDLK